jgi:pilus assembly protein CpaC
VDFVPLALGNGRVRLEVRPQVSEIDPSRSVSINNTTVPGLRSRWVDTAVEMNAGQTLALAGLIQTQVESEIRGVPVLADLPWVGAAFRRVREQANEIELLVLVTPEFVDALDPQEVPPCGPGELTTSPNDCELYGRGYIEVPNECNNNCRVGLYDGSETMMPAGEPIPVQDLLPNAQTGVQYSDPSAVKPVALYSRPVVKAPAAPGAARPALIGPVGYEGNP